MHNGLMINTFFIYSFTLLDLEKTKQKTKTGRKSEVYARTLIINLLAFKLYIQAYVYVNPHALFLLILLIRIMCCI